MVEYGEWVVVNYYSLFDEVVHRSCVRNMVDRHILGEH